MQELSLNELAEVAGGLNVGGVVPCPMPAPAPIGNGFLKGVPVEGWFGDRFSGAVTTKPPLQVRYN